MCSLILLQNLFLLQPIEILGSHAIANFCKCKIHKLRIKEKKNFLKKDASIGFFAIDQLA